MTEIATLQEAIAGLTSGDPSDRIIGTGKSGPRGVESQIEFNGIVMNDRNLIDTFLVTQIDGIDDADVRDTRDVNPGQHGETPGNSFYGGRTIVLSGKVVTKTLPKLRDMLQGFRQAFVDLSRELPLIFRTGDPSKDLMIYCKKATALRIPEAQDTLNDFKRIFQVSLRASNPRFLSVVEVFSSIDFSSLYDFSDSDSQTTESFTNTSLFTRYVPEGSGYEIVSSLLQPKTGQITYRNLAINPSFQNGVIDYIATGASISQLISGGVDGKACCKVNVIVNGDASVSKTFSAIPGDSYSFSSFVQSPGTARWASVEIDWFDATSTLIDYTAGELSLTSGGWQRLPGLQNVMAPAGAVTGVAYTVFHGSSSGDEHRVDHCMLVDQPLFPGVDYFDGNDWFADWQADRDNSVSIMRPYMRLLANRNFESVQQTVKFKTPVYAPLILDAFGSNTLANYTISPSSGHGLVIAGGKLTVTSTTTKTMRHDGAVSSDGRVAYKIHVGNSGAFSSKAIFRMLDFNNYIYGEITDTGSLRIGKADNGSFSIFSSNPIAAPSANTDYWIRFIVNNNELTVEWWSTDPLLGGNAIATWTHTLTGADAVKFGSGVSGKAGMQMTPFATNYTYDDFEMVASVSDDIRIVLAHPSDNDFVYAELSGSGKLSVNHSNDGLITKYVGSTSPIAFAPNTNYWLRGRMAKGNYFVELYKTSDPNTTDTSVLVANSATVMSFSDIANYQDTPSKIGVMFKNRGAGFTYEDWRFESVDHPMEYDYYLGAGTLKVQGNKIVPITSSQKIMVINNLSYDAGDVEMTIKHHFDTALGSSTYEAGMVSKYLGPGDFILSRIRQQAGTKVLEVFAFNDGIPTLLKTGTIPTLLAVSTDYWLRYTIVGNVINIQHWTTDPVLGGAPVFSASATTLAGADATKFGIGIIGNIGLEMNSPVSVSPSIDDFRVFFTSFDDIAFNLFNEGNFEAQPVLELTGPLEGLQIVNEANTQSIIFDDDVPNGEKWILDTSKPRLYRDSDGQSKYGSLNISTSQTFELDTKQNGIRVIASGLTDESQVAIRFHHTYM